MFFFRTMHVERSNFSQMYFAVYSCISPPKKPHNSSSLSLLTVFLPRSAPNMFWHPPTLLRVAFLAEMEKEHRWLVGWQNSVIATKPPPPRIPLFLPPNCLNFGLFSSFFYTLGPSYSDSKIRSDKQPAYDITRLNFHSALSFPHFFFCYASISFLWLSSYIWGDDDVKPLRERRVKSGGKYAEEGEGTIKVSISITDLLLSHTNSCRGGGRDGEKVGSVLWSLTSQ